jgi:phage terminase large subunit
VDFGYVNPFVWQAWAADPDGRLYRYMEIYRTQGLVEDHARAIAAEHDKRFPRPVVLICDHDAEDRATLERHLGIGTTPAHKAVTAGIQAVQARLRPAGDKRPRLFLLDNALRDRDESLIDAKKPASTEEEIESYAWQKGADGRPLKEAPHKLDDHGMDAMRYLVAFVDLLGAGRVSYGPDLFE